MMDIYKQVPGNFHISTHSSREQPASGEMAHTVHEVLFGDIVAPVGILKLRCSSWIISFRVDLLPTLNSKREQVVKYLLN